jgi:hypothetical protein
MTGSAGTAESAVMTVRTGVAPKTCNSSPGNANLRIGTQAGSDEDSHSDSQRSDALRHTSSTSPTHGTVISPFRRYVHPQASWLPPPASFLLSPVIPASPGVIPAQAGILTRSILNQGHTVGNNHAGMPPRHLSHANCSDLCVLKSLVWIRTICRSRRPYPD